LAHRRADVGRVDGLDQDAQGFLWLATPQGLVRFDGMELKVVDPDAPYLVPGCARTGPVRRCRAVPGRGRPTP
jgi:ligand-binding sensor domain-containing protein